MTSESTHERKIIEKIRAGEINHFEFIVKHYSSKIQHYILKRLGDSAEADDLTQNVFLKFYRAVTDYKFDAERAIAPYLFQIAANELKMHYRSMKKTVSLEEIPEIEDNNGKEIGFEEDTDEILRGLKEQEKVSIKMLSEGYQYHEIAEKFRVPLNTVKTWIRRGREKIRAVMHKDK